MKNLLFVAAVLGFGQVASADIVAYLEGNFLSATNSQGKQLLSGISGASDIQVSAHLISYMRDGLLYVMNEEGNYVVNGKYYVTKVILGGKTDR